MAEILVIDDDAVMVELVSALLGDEGHAVRVASNGEAGLAAAIAQPPALIILDMNMPGMSGYDLAQKLRGHPVTGKIKLLALTAHATSGAYDDAYKAGCDGFVAKPLQADRLSEKVAELLQK